MSTTTPTVSQSQVEHALLRLESAVDSPRALTIQPQDHAELHQAIDRAHAQLLTKTDAVLTIALAGCTGAGKSTLINALAGTPIAEASDRRPCTMQPRVYHHRDVPAGGLPADLAQQATFVSHDYPPLRNKVIVDTPDLDTFHTQNRAATCAMLKAAGLVIYLFSPERYAEERAWSVIRQEQRFSACLAVLNKADTVAPDVLSRIADEVRRRFADMGKPDIRVLCISAAAHVPSAAGRLAGGLSPAGPDRPIQTATRAADTPLDEFITLRAYIEHELQAGDMARMIRQQRTRVVDHLQTRIDLAIPADADSKLDGLAEATRRRTDQTIQTLAERMHEPLLAVEADFEPLVVVRKHQRFWGPFRTWLAIADFLRYGLPRVVRRLRVFDSEPSTFAARTLADHTDAVADAVRAQARDLQDHCYDAHLPVERWQAVTADIDGRRILADITSRIESRYESLAAKAFRRNTVFIWSVSLLGWLLPAGLVLFAFINLLRQFVGGPLAAFFGPDRAIGRFFADRPAGGDVLWDCIALVVLSYLLLHMATGIVLSARNLLASAGVARQSLDAALRQTMDRWLTSYRDDLRADLADLRDSMTILHAAATGTILRPADRSSTSPQEEPSLTASSFDALLSNAPSPTASSPAAPSEPELTPADLLRRSMQPPKN